MTVAALLAPDFAPPPGVTLYISAEAISAKCRRCSARGRWGRADVDFAVERVRAHGADCSGAVAS